MQNFYSFEKTKECVGFFFFNNLIAPNGRGTGARFNGACAVLGAVFFNFLAKKI